MVKVDNPIPETKSQNTSSDFTSRILLASLHKLNLVVISP